MFTIRHLLAITTLAVIFSASLSGCGQKGPLVLPQEDASAASAVQEQE